MDRVRLYAVALALILSLLTPLYLGAAAFAAKAHLVSADFALNVLIAKGAMLLLGSAILIAAVACALAFLVQPRGGRAASLVCLSLTIVFFGALSAAIASAKNAPPIHDISTDTNDRPVFSEKTAALRGADSFGAAQAAAAIQREHYPGVKSMPFAVPPDAAFDATLKALQRRKLPIINADKASGTIEATSETPWFGVRQDIIVRIRATDTGSIIDVRSASRTGISDFGANAKTVTTLLQAIKTQLLGGA